MLWRGLASVLALVPSIAFAEPPLTQPTGNWVVDVAANECLLIRPYGTPADPLYLAVSKAPMADGSEFTILYKSGRSVLGNGEATISFDGGPSITATYGSMLLLNRSKALDVKTLRSVTIGQDVDKPEPLARDAKSVSIIVPKEMSGNFALPDQAAALEQLDNCARKLGVEWGYPLEEQARMKQFSSHRRGLGWLFSGSDYPPGAVLRNEMGRVRVRIRVSDTGAPTDCAVLSSSGSKDLDTTTCYIIRRRARFDPAVDVEGKNVRSVYTTTVNWVLMG